MHSILLPEAPRANNGAQAARELADEIVTTAYTLLLGERELTPQEQSAIAESYAKVYAAFCERMELIDFVQRFTACNAKVRDVVITACYLAGVPSDELDSLFWFARTCWREHEIEIRKLEQYHGGKLPPMRHTATWPRPSWATKARAA